MSAPPEHGSAPPEHGSAPPEHGSAPPEHGSARREHGRAVTGALGRLARLLRREGGLMASLLEPGAEDAPSGDGPAALAASGPRAAGRREDYELLVEAIYEGYLLHYGRPRVMCSPEADLKLLAGDRLYAIGLAKLVELGDTFAVAELADVISLSALAQAAGEPELADAVWTAGARAVGWGPPDGHRRAKELLLSGAPEAIDAMRTSARSESTPP